jgi:nucleotide-binding universal stress UspA family protein
MNLLKRKGPRRTSSPVTKAGRGKGDKATPRIKTIVVPTDFSAESLKAIRQASMLAKEFGAVLWLVHVVERPPVLKESLAAGVLLSSEELERSARVGLNAWARDEVDELVPVHVDAREGKPFLEIVNAAKIHDADLIVIATHGHTGLKHAYLGSTAERVVQHAPCPVLVVRAKEKAA